MESDLRKPIGKDTHKDALAADGTSKSSTGGKKFIRKNFKVKAQGDYHESASLAVAAFYALAFRYQREEPTLVRALNENDSRFTPRVSAISLDAGTNGTDLLKNAEHILLGKFSDSTGETSPFGTIRIADSRGEVEPQDDIELTVVFSPEEGDLDLTFSVNESETLGITAERLAEHFSNLFILLRDAPGKTVSKLSLLGVEETELVRGLGRHSPNVSEPVHRLVEKLTGIQPTAAAVKYRDKAISFQELNDKSNRIAHYLLSLDLESSSNILVCLRPSFESMTTMFGIWKAGYTYVPVDPEFPAERIQHIVEDSNAAHLFLDAELRKTVDFKGVGILGSDEIGRRTEPLSTENPSIETEPESAAYIIYTSGTTGLPKGVITSHQNLTHYVTVAIENLGFDSDISIPSIARTTFSITFFERVMPLVAGGSVLLLDRDNILSFDLLIERLENVNTVHTSPSLFKKLIEHIDFNKVDLAKFDHLEHVSTGGDMVPPDVLEGIKRVFRNAEIFVLYGCSEVSCMATYQFYPRGESVSRTYVGKAFNNVEIRLVDQFSNLVPFGAVGEVYIGGDGISKQYLNRPELSAEKFLELDGARFYRTGDRGRRDADGRLEILGRSDFQIKLRGIRIEPAEIESQLRTLPEVREAIVAKRLLNENETLVAYVVASAEEKVDESDIRRSMETKLPDYMVPTVYQFIEALPVNFNQKVDRNALPEVVISRPKSDTKKPKSELEHLIFESWKEVLGTDEFGITHHFFELGGHSLLLAEVLAKIETKTGLDIPFSTLLGNLTITSLAAELTNISSESGEVETRLDTPIPEDGILQLSHGQKRIWFSEELSPRTPVYNIPVTVELDGNLDTKRLEAALLRTFDNYPILNSRFARVDGVPVQILERDPKFKLVHFEPDPDLSDSVEQQIEKRVLEVSNFNLDLTAPPMVQGLLIKQSEKRHILVLNFHHIVFDAWSIDLFFKDLTQSYSDPEVESMTNLERLQAGYHHFVNWQTEFEKSGALEPSLDFWKEYLAGAENPPLLPADNPSNTSEGHEGGSVFFDLERELVEGLAELGKNSSASLFMTLLAGFAVLLNRYSGEEDIVIGTPVSTRDRPEFKGIVGFMVNTIALRLQMDPEASFADVLEATRDLCIEAYQHYHVPFEMVVEHAGAKRESSIQPIFRTMFVLQDEPSQMLSLDNVTTSWRQTEKTHSMFDVTLWMTQTTNGLRGEWEYSSALFDEETLERISVHFETLLESILKNPHAALRELPLMHEQERTSLVVDSNGNKATVSDKRVFELFEEQAAEEPGSPAIIFLGKALSYEELNGKANQIARFLLEKGANQGDKIGICLDRSTTLIASMLAVQKIGCSYVPIDPSFPADRISFVIEDANASLVVSNSWSVESLTGVDQEILDLDSDHGSIERLSSSNLNIPVREDALAYSIYTSGSTGLPKGVNIGHRAVTNFVESMAQVPGISEADSVLAITTVSFDIAVLEIFVPLTKGAKIILADEETARDAKLLRALIDEAKPTVIQATPATWQMLITSGWEGDPGLKALCGGEALTVQLANLLAPRVDELWNMYGPTEATVWSCIGRVEENTDRVLIGKPINNTQTYVIDSELFESNGKVELLPPGVVGELLIGGEGLAEGYHNRKELTADRFITNSLLDNGGRLYRTGDLARKLSDGRLECLGRNDNQIKLRGFRIELGEIEAVLEKQSSVLQAVVDVKTDEDGGQNLVAYLLRKEETIDSKKVRLALRKHLPEYMIPSHFYVVDEFPLTPNGKTDRKALGKLELEPSRSKSGDDQPRDEVEKKLASIWEEILGTTNVGIDDSFFEIGGHSLRAVRMFSRLEEEFLKTLPLATLFEAQTIRELSQLLRDNDWSAPESSLVPIQPKGEKTPFFCMHAAGGNVLFYKDLARRLGTDRPFYGLQARKLSGQQIGHETIEEMAAYYIKEIVKAQPSGPYLIGGSSYGGLVAWEVAKQLNEAGEEIGLLALFDTFGPGYPEYLSNTTPWKTKFFSIARRIQNHALSIRMLDGKSRVDYIRDKIGKVRHRFGVKYRNRKRARARKRYETMEKTLPNELIQLEDKISEAGTKYKPLPYSGLVGIFRASNQPLGIKPDPMIGWSDLVAGEKKVIEVPGHHGSIVREPYAKNLVEVLDPIIEKIFAE